MPGDRSQLAKALAAIDAKIAGLQTARALIVEVLQKPATPRTRTPKAVTPKDAA